MDDPTPQEPAVAFQAEDAEHVADVDERPEVVSPQCFQAEDGEHSPARTLRMRVS